MGRRPLVARRSKRNTETNITLWKILQISNKERLFLFSVFQQLLNQMLKTDGVSAWFFQIFTLEMLKTRKYTPSIHSFNQVFNILFR